MNQLYNPQEFAALVLRAVGNTKKKELLSGGSIYMQNYIVQHVGDYVCSPGTVSKKESRGEDDI